MFYTTDLNRSFLLWISSTLLDFVQLFRFRLGLWISSTILYFVHWFGFPLAVWISSSTFVLYYVRAFGFLAYF